MTDPATPHKEELVKKPDIDHYFGVLEQLSAKTEALPSATVLADDKAAPSHDYHTVASAPSVDINSEIVREQKLKNDNVEQDIRLKRETLNRLFIFLTAETALIFALAFFQAVHWPFRFHLEEWSFRLVLTVTILQITGMLYVAVRYLFPKSRANA